MIEVCTAEESQLIEDCRTGRVGAVLELFRIHWEPALAYARMLSRSSHDAEDIAATAFLKSLTALRRGKGPVGPVRPYLFRAVRTAAADHHSSSEIPHERIADLVDRARSPKTHVTSDAHDFVAEAFAMLPLRWQRVLWYVEIEGLKPREVAPLLEIAPNAVSALLRRARRGLREAYLLVYQGDAEEKACDFMLGLLARAVLGNNSLRDQAVVDCHVRTCRKCRHAYQGLRRVRSRMRGLMAPGFLTVLLSPVTAVRILDTVSNPAHCPLACITESMDESVGVIRLLFQGIKSVGAATAAVVIMVLPLSPDLPAPDSQPAGPFGVCTPYGPALGCLQPPRP